MVMEIQVLAELVVIPEGERGVNSISSEIKRKSSHTTAFQH
jgi:hypothetical protein